MSDSTKACPQCGNTYLILLRTLNIKWCPDCKLEITWPLDKDQKPLV